MPVIELRRTDRTKAESRALAQFASNETSQWGEDGIIAEIFKRIGLGNKWCVEFGAWDGKHYSNTWGLIAKQDWSAVLIEGMADRARTLSDLHRATPRVHVLNNYVGWQGDNSLDNLLARTPIPEDFDLLSVDIDGNDWHVWKSLTNYRPRVVVIEFNPTASNDLYFVQDADPAVNQGASLLALFDLAKDKGYELVATTESNGIFVLKSEFAKIGIADNSIDAIHAPQYTTELMQGYDANIFAAGEMNLLWHNHPLTQDDFQVLPKRQRGFPPPFSLARTLRRVTRKLRK